MNKINILDKKEWVNLKKVKKKKWGNRKKERVGKS